MPAFDDLLRAALGLPGRVLDWVDGAPVPPADPVGPERVYPLVRARARWPEAHLGLEDGLHYVVADDHVLPYQLRGRTAFAIGGLNAGEDARRRLLDAFTATLSAWGARRRLLFPLRREELPDARAAGFSAVQVGVEAWIDLEGLTLRGAAWAHLRQMTNRAGKRGVVVEECVAADHAGDMAALHHAWLDAKRPKWRMKLLVGSPGLARPFDRRYFVARREGRLEGFVTVLPGGPGQWGLDVMCRRPDAVPGTMEALVTHAARTLRGEGAATLSLGACPMAGVPLRDVGWIEGPRPILRRGFRLLFGTRLGNRVFAFQNLYRFKQKFNPRWEPVYFAAQPRLGVLELYLGCRMWGLY